LKNISYLNSLSITNERIIKIFHDIPRKLFIPIAYHSLADLDKPLPIGCGQTISQPSLVAFMTEKLDVNKEHNILEIGTGTGFQTAILASLCKTLYTIEVVESLSKKAENNITTLNIKNVNFVHGDGHFGYPSAAPYHRIMVTAAAKIIPKMLLDQLLPGGKMIIPVGNSGEDQLLQIITKSEVENITINQALIVRFVPMISSNKL